MQIIDMKKKCDYYRIDISNNIIVGILLKRSIGLITTMFSCFKNRITYIPIDPNWPDERINTIISDNHLKMIITTKEYSDRINSAQVIVIDDRLSIEITKPIVKNEISYILYTSGSTGVPKGVEIKYDSLCNFINGISEIIDFTAGKRIACLTSVSFDIFFLESIMALEKGLTIVLANEDEQQNPRLMADLIRENNVDMIQMTPSKMQLLLNCDEELSCLKNVKEIMIGGEPFPPNLLRNLQRKTTANIYNMYGPTETTIWSTISKLTHKNRIDIGRPISNTKIYIMDKDFSIVPNGQAGEICIAGKGLARGYVGRFDLTNEKFQYLPNDSNVRIYRTGDIGRYLPDNNLEYLGRMDNQVKIRGHRIELEEIEATINQYIGINQSVVTIKENSKTSKELQAFYTSDNPIDHNKLIQYLSSKLPQFMVPTIFKRVEGFVQMSNGKIDRKKVFECIEVCDQNSIRDKLDVEDLNDLQKKVIKIITLNLGSKLDGKITLKTKLASTGLDSITFIKIVIALENEFNFEFDYEKLIIREFPTIMSMIEYLETKI